MEPLLALPGVQGLKIIETEKLWLRELSPRVYEHAFTHFNEQEIMDFFGLETDEDLEKEKEKYTGGLKTFNKTYFIFHMIEKSGGKTVGMIGYHTWYLQHDRAEIFYYIRNEDNRRKGYAGEAIIPVLDYGFHEMGLNRIEAMLSARNIPSVKMMEKGGFTKEGILRKHYFINEQFEDSDIYGLLRSEYEQMKG